MRIPIKATAREPISRPDTYQRFSLSSTSSVAKCSRSIHLGQNEKSSVAANAFHSSRNSRPCRLTTFRNLSVYPGIGKLISRGVSRRMSEAQSSYDACDASLCLWGYGNSGGPYVYNQGNVSYVSSKSLGIICPPVDAVPRRGFETFSFSASITIFLGRLLRILANRIYL